MANEKLVKMYKGEEFKLKQIDDFNDNVLPTYDFKIDSEFKIDEDKEFTMDEKTIIFDIYLCILIFNVMRKKSINLGFIEILKIDAEIPEPENYNLFKIPNLLLSKPNCFFVLINHLSIFLLSLTLMTNCFRIFQSEI